MEIYRGITLYQLIMSMNDDELAAYLCLLMDCAVLSASEGRDSFGVFEMLEKLRSEVQ